MALTAQRVMSDGRPVLLPTAERSGGDLGSPDIGSRLEDRSDDGDSDRGDDDGQGDLDRGLRDGLPVLAPVDEPELIGVQGVDDEFEADEAEDDCQAVVEVDEPVEQSIDEEVELAQTQQGEGVGGEDQEGFYSQRVDRGDGVDGEHDVGGADGDDAQHHGGDHGAAGVAVDDLAPHEAVGHGDDAGDELDEAAGPVLLVLVVGLLNALSGLGEGGPQEPGSEEVEDPGEVIDERSTCEDEDEPEDEGDDDAGEQHLLLVLPGYLEGGHHDDEDEEVVDAQRLLGDVAAQVLLGESAAPHEPDDAAEDQGHGDIGHRPDGSLLHGGLVRRAHVTDDVDRDEGQDDGRQADPPQNVDVHVFSSGTELVPEVSSRHGRRRSKLVPLWPRRRERRTACARTTVMTTSPLVGSTPLRV